MTLAEKVAIVAGGAKGIGKASSILLARKGAKVIVGDVAEKEGKQTIEEIQDQGGEGFFVHCDATNGKDVQKLVNTSVKMYGSPNVLFSSIGIYARAKLAETKESLWDNMMRVNVKSAFLLCKTIIPHMQKAGGGSIILSSSSVGWHDSAPNITAYATSKFAITGLTKSAACDYLHDNIRVNCICPGPTDTPMIRGGRSPEELETFVDSIPIGRLADPDEVAQSVLFLASDESAYITGVAFPVDGGQTAWI